MVAGELEEWRFRVEVAPGGVRLVASSTSAPEMLRNPHKIS